MSSISAINRRYYARSALASDPNWRKREVLRPAMWDEEFLTERWEDRKARLGKERESKCD